MKFQSCLCKKSFIFIILLFITLILFFYSLWFFKKNFSTRGAIPAALWLQKERDGASPKKGFMKALRRDIHFRAFRTRTITLFCVVWRCGWAFLSVTTWFPLVISCQCPGTCHLDKTLFHVCHPFYRGRRKGSGGRNIRLIHPDFGELIKWKLLGYDRKYPLHLHKAYTEYMTL